MRREQVSEITKGGLLILIGLLFLGEQLRWTESWSFGRLWPLILVVLGAGRWLGSRGDGRRSGGIILVFLGGVFLMHTHGVLRLEQSWPLFIVAGGLSILLGCRDQTRGVRDGEAGRP